jgi:cytochrome c oxidase assembly protein subunit 15
MQEFSKYQQTPQYHFLNYQFTLKDFKFIFFWEWFHRLWARLIGVVFLIPFIIFLVQKRFRPSMVRPMMVLFLLGALQGAVGWIMVASGLEGDAVYVRPTRLALHFIFALGLLCYTFWFALDLMVPIEKRVKDMKAKRFILITLSLLALQLIYGALMAGHKAATAAPTWPDINGKFIPEGMNSHSGLLNLIDNKIVIHFIHRGLAYLLLILIIVLSLRLAKIKGSLLFSRNRWWPLILVLIQTFLGILTVLNSLQIIPNQWGAFEWLALLHQTVAMALLLSLVWMWFMVTKPFR